MSLIEKAAQRLDQLKQATAEPGDGPAELQPVPAVVGNPVPDVLGGPT